MAKAPSLRVLVVDDDPDTRANLCDILELDSYHVEVAGSVGEVLGRTDLPTFAAVLLDRKLPDGTAEELLPQLRRLAPEAAVLIITGYADLSGAIDALRQGAADYILKPINADALRASLNRLVEQQRLRSEKEHAETVFRTLVEAAPCLIVILRPDHAVAYFSPFAEEVTGYPAAQVVSNNFLEVFLPEAHRLAGAERARQVLAGLPLPTFEEPIISHSGKLRWLVWQYRLLKDYEGAPAVMAVGQDITAVKLAQEKMLQSERLAAIGQMMTGLAHESGNALARSRSSLEMLSWEVEDRPEALQLIADVRKAQEHLAHLYEEVRGYAAPLKLEREVWNLHGVWRQAWTNLALARQGRDATLREAADGVDLQCAVDQFRLEQVFRNIFENSLAACRDPMLVDVRCSETNLDGVAAIQVSLRDNGPGLNAEQRQRIFDPFFTTKTKGTGLGMAIARRIVEAHGGRIAVGDASGPGAEVLLTLPRAAF